jgi:hypothetical protein
VFKFFWRNSKYLYINYRTQVINKFQLKKNCWRKSKFKFWLLCRTMNYQYAFFENQMSETKEIDPNTIDLLNECMHVLLYEIMNTSKYILFLRKSSTTNLQCTSFNKRLLYTKKKRQNRKIERASFFQGSNTCTPWPCEICLVSWASDSLSQILLLSSSLYPVSYICTQTRDIIRTVTCRYI